MAPDQTLRFGANRLAGRTGRSGVAPRQIALGGASIALVPLAHNAVALLTMPAFMLLTLLRGRVAKQPLVSIAAGGAPLLAGLCLSTFFWLPVLVEKPFVKMDL